MIDQTTYQNRREQLRRLLQRDKLDALLVTQPANRYYLSGFELHDGQCNESNGCLIICKDGRDWLCTDSRFQLAAHQVWDPDMVVIYNNGQANGVNALIKDQIGGKIGFDPDCLPWSYVKTLADGLSLAPAPGLVEEMRVIKDEDELLLLEQSALLNHDMMAWLPSILIPGTSEAEVAWEIEKFFREHGASELSFPSIVAKDQNAALPHYQPDQSSKLLSENCHVLVDAGARLRDYCSDQTRTFWVGQKVSERFSQTLDLVREAQRAAINILRPGLTGRQAHKAANDYFAKHKLDQYFTHSLGHGVGLEVHEEPRLSPRSNTELAPGMVVTVEPGLYYQDWGGIRWEFMVVITEDSCRIL